MSIKPIVSAIIVNYNGGNQIIKCIESLMIQTCKELEIVVVDNASYDDSIKNIKALFPEIRIIENTKNYGWGLACNIGIKATEGQYVVMLNNDAFLHELCIEEMLKAIKINPNYGSCACKILLWDRPDLIEVASLVITRDGLSVGRGRLQNAGLYNKIEEVFCANDCCCMYRREMLDDIGLYDPDFFIYADETEMGFRHQFYGWKCVYTPFAIAYHAHSHAAGSYSDFKAYHVERNRIFICLKYFPVMWFLKSFLYAGVRYLFQLYYSMTGKGALAHYMKKSSLFDGLKVLVRAYKDAFKMSRVMIKRRRYINLTKRISSKDFSDLFVKYAISIKQAARYE